MVVYLTLPLYNQITGKTMTLDYGDPVYVVSLLGIMILTGLVAGSYPALFLSRLEPVRILKGTLKFSPESILLRKGLVVFQFVLSITLIVGTLVIYRQMEFIRTRNMGFDRENLIYLPAEGDLYKNIDAFKTELAKSASIKDVSSCNHLPNAIQSSSGDLKFPGQRPDEMVQVAATSVSENYLATIGAKLAAGRDFEGKKDTSNYIVNETAVKLMRLKGDPVGQEISFWNGKGRIIGVAKDFHIHSVHAPIAPLVLTYSPQNVSYVLARVEGSRTQDALFHMADVYRKFLPDYTMDYHFLDEAFENQYKSEVIVGQLTNYFSGLGIFIACLGLLGLAMSTAEQRTREIGIRKVLGASVVNLITLLSKDFLKLVLLAFVIATPVAWYLVHTWLGKFAYKIDVHWWIFGIAGLLALLIALLTVSFQSIRSALANPVKSLRSE
jgi:ABC-type antimicrobial peptide transport system permease subunit